MANDNFNNALGAEIGWDDEIAEESQFTLLDEGDYDFTVTSFERARFAGSAKMCACNQIILHLDVDGVILHENLFMNKKTEWKLSQFLIAIGMKQKGVPCKINWNAINGARGRCKVGIRKWTGNDGSERESNEIKTFYEPAPGAASPQQPSYQRQSMTGYQNNAQPQWQAGKF